MITQLALKADGNTYKFPDTDFYPVSIWHEYESIQYIVN